MKNDFDYQTCGLAETMKFIGSKWTIPILFSLSHRRHRFGELQKSLGVSPRTLALRLDQMERDGLLIRRVYAQVPPKVEYSLSKRGQSLGGILKKMCEWGEKIPTKDNLL